MRHFNEHIVLGRYQCPKRIEPTFYDVIHTLTHTCRHSNKYKIAHTDPQANTGTSFYVYLAVFYEHFEICARFK